MGVRQAYKGNPELKEYYLVSNFSGGINTSVADESIRDYEFRDLQNMDINKEGTLENRKGFAEITALNNLLELGNITIPSGTMSLFRIIKNDYNIFEKYINEELNNIGWYELSTSTYWDANGDVGGTYDLGPTYISTIIPEVTEIDVAMRIADDTVGYRYFKSIAIPLGGYYGSIYLTTNTPLLQILMIIDNKVYTLELTTYRTLAIDVPYIGTQIKVLRNMVYEVTLTNIQKNSHDLPPATSYVGRITLADTVDFNSKIYISLTDISSLYQGIFVFDVDNLEWWTWRGRHNDNSSASLWAYVNEDTYKPTPYNIDAVGYNVLSETPLNWVDTQDTGLIELRSMAVLNIDAIPVEKIPASGNFILRVYYTGSSMTEDNIGVEAYSEYDVSLPFTITSITQEDAYFDILIENLKFMNTNYVRLRVYQKIAQTQTKTIDANYTLWPYNGIAPNSYFSVVSGIVSIYRNAEGSKNETSSEFSLIASDVFSYAVTGMSVYSASFATAFAAQMIPANNGKYFEMYDEDGYVRYAMYVSSTTSFTESEFSGGTKTIANRRITSLNYAYASLNQVVYDTDGDVYYVRTFVNGVEDDFVLLDSVTTFDDIDSIYYIGESVINSTTGLDLRGVKLIEIGNCLVMYKGNTIWFSQPFQFDYFPHSSLHLFPFSGKDEIQLIKYYKGAHIIFTKEKLYKMKGTFGTDDWEFQILNEFIGCVAPYTVKSLENTLYFMSSRGLYRITQNYYLDGLENVDRADDNVLNLFPLDYELCSVIYKNQYITYLPSTYDYDAIKMYYNIDLPNKQHPFIKDVYTNRPDFVTMVNGIMYTLKNGMFYIYDSGYTDFFQEGYLESDYTYTCLVKTSALNLGYPTHEKKLKAMYFKVIADIQSYLYFTVWTDGYLSISPYSTTVSLDDNEEIVYTEALDDTLPSNMYLGKYKLGDFELGTAKLGDRYSMVHKIAASKKGKTFQVQIEEKSNGRFVITNIGYLYKLGKIKEMR